MMEFLVNGIYGGFRTWTGKKDDKTHHEHSVAYMGGIMKFDADNRELAPKGAQVKVSGNVQISENQFGINVDYSNVEMEEL